jgi:hypothetical protein
MRFAVIVLVGAALLAGGCRKSKQQAQATTPAPPAATSSAAQAPHPQGGGGREVSPGGGGAVMAVRGAVDRTKAENDLKQIGLFYQQYADTNGKPPANQQDFLGYIQREARELAQHLQDGWYVVYWKVNPATLPAGTSNTVLAYQSDLPTSGGMALMADGSVQRMTAQQFAAAPKAGS